jgi:hypothetical protein
MCSNDGSGADESVEEIEEVRCRGGCADAEEDGDGDGGIGIVILVLMLGKAWRGVSEELERQRGMSMLTFSGLAVLSDF